MIEELPIACSLDVSRRSARRVDVAELWNGATAVEDLEDGVAIRFPGDSEWVGRLAEFIAFERECCRFLRFEVICEQAGGSIELRLRGPEGTKEFVRAWLL
ncbi:MAG TPA: hypothetical protein VF188_16095 [Longimicrobiales bacterium]